jgi:predicted RNA methylase
MSATNRGGQRIEHDIYETPAWCVRRFLERVRLPAGRWCDPCAGNGAIVRAVRRKNIEWSVVELRRECAEPLRAFCVEPVIGDYMQTDTESDVIITNPPFSLAMPFVQKALGEADHVAMLLRVNFLASAERAELEDDDGEDEDSESEAEAIGFVGPTGAGRNLDGYLAKYRDGESKFRFAIEADFARMTMKQMEE